MNAILKKIMPHPRWAVISVPYLWMLVFFAIPFLIVLKISFSKLAIAMPPYTPVLEFVDNAVSLKLNLSNYIGLFTDSQYVQAYLSSIKIAGISTLLALLIGYPMAYGIARAKPFMRLVLMMLVILAFWTSSLLRTYAMIGILKANGLLAQALSAVGLAGPDFSLLHSDTAVYIGIVYNYLPFMILPLTATLMRLDFTLLEAAEDLGAKPWQAFARVTLPLSMPGIIAGALLVFIPAVGEFVIPDILGGPDALTIGRVLWIEFFTNRDWPLAAAVTIAMLVLIVLPTLLFEYVENRRAEREAQA